MCFHKQAAINSVGMGGRDDGYLMPGLADSRRWLFILKGKILMLILADGRDLPPPPPQFDDPPPAAGLDQFGRGSKLFQKQKTDLVNFSLAIFARRVHDLDNVGHGQLPRLPAGQLADQIPSGSSLLHLLPVLLHGHPHDHTGCDLFLFLLKEFLFSRQLPQDRIQTRSFSLLVTTT